MQKNVFWDFDGTLFNTYPIMVDSFADSLEEMSIDEVEIDKYDILLTMRQHSLGTALQKFAAEFSINKDDLSNIYHSFEKEDIIYAKPFLNVEKVLKKITENGGKNYLLTHRDKSSLKLLQDFNLRNLFADVVTKNQAFKRKPDPESLNYLIKKHNIIRSDSIMIGDRKLDIDAAHNASIEGCLFDNNNLIESKGNPEIQINNYYDFLQEYFK
ncbi:HAD-IA family hydrolase [Apilactobacillus quenuiae]|uniref:HAD-IA family hydrolase n=1 Tax=Apilactobacillus quenuiae TaxID=2008377 RepID=UPI000D01DB2B|nr:HAD-IA family hydrolase [Apilactobacillus quenuiae]